MTANKTISKARYRDRLGAHPGKVVATFFTVGGALAGGLAGALIMGAASWGIVLWTARTQPVHEDEP